MSRERTKLNTACCAWMRAPSRRCGGCTLKPVETHLKRIPFCSLLILCFSIAAQGQEPANPRNLLPGNGINAVKTLQQNWSDVESRAFYDAPQGSQLLPYRWFLCLEQPDNDKRFLDPDHIRDLGYLPRSRDRFGNPDGLPIGFVRDMPFRDGSPSLGMTCAACHTTQINHNNVAWLIDGAPTMGDIETFQRRLQAALLGTIEDDSKFNRFADKVLRQASEDDKTELKQRMRRFESRRRGFNERNLPATGMPHFGYGRMDAFGAILNEVTVTALNLPENQRPADAPVSYPFLWDTPQHNFVQWNGIAPNTVSRIARLFVGTRHIGALGRNTGEVLGAFGKVNLDRAHLLGGYTSSVNRRSLIDIEDSVRRLWSPVWPAAEFGGIDTIKRNAGRGLFNQHCASCHTNNGREYEFDRTDPKRTVNARMEAVGTDETMYLNFALRRSETGVLKGRHSSLSPFSKPLKAEEPAGKILEHIVPRIITGPNFDVRSLRPNQLAALEVPMSLDLSFKTSEGLLTGNFNTIALHGGKNKFLVLGNNISFVPNAKTLPDAGILTLSMATSGIANFHSTTESFASDRFNTLSGFKTLPAFTTLDEPPGFAAADSQFLVSSAVIVVKYKARPLNGIWATAPYLHNGSVPNLLELLKPASERRTTFSVGNREFDTEKVGFKSDGGGSFKFDTTLPGNSNSGHEYGKTLSPTEKLQLIEYLKSL